MAVIEPGTRVLMTDTSRVQPGGIGFNFRLPGSIRGFYIQSLSNHTLYLRWRGGPPSAAADANLQLNAFEHHAAPVEANEIVVASASSAAIFIIAAWDEPVPFFHANNPATVPTAAAIKLEDGTIAGQYAAVSAAGVVSVSGAVTVGGTVDVADRAGRLLGVIGALPAGANTIGAVDVTDRAGRALGVVASITAPVDVSDRAGRLLGVVASITAALPAGTNLLGSVGPDKGALTDRSGTITTGATAQNAAASNAARKFLEIGNPNNNIGSGGLSLWYSLVGAAAPNGQGSVELVSGGVARYDGTFVPTSAVSVVAATTGHKFYAAEA